MKKFVAKVGVLVVLVGATFSATAEPRTCAQMWQQINDGSRLFMSMGCMQKPRDFQCNVVRNMIQQNTLSWLRAGCADQRKGLDLDGFKTDFE